MVTAIPGEIVMNLIRSVRMGPRQIIGFATILALMVAITVFAGFEVRKINMNLSTISDKNSVVQRYAINFRGSVHDRAIAVRDVVLDDQAGFQADLAEIAQLEKFYETSAVQMDLMFEDPANISPGDKTLLADIKAIEAETMPMIVEIISLRKTNKVEEARTLLLAKARPNFVLWLARINALIDAKEVENQSLAKETRAIAAGFTELTFAICLVSVLIGIIFAWWNIQSVRSLQCVTKSMLQLANGELNAQFPTVKNRDEVSDIISATAVFQNNMIQSQELVARDAEETRAREQRAKHIEQMTRGFDESISELLQTMAVASNDMQTTATSMSDIAEASMTRTTIVAEAAERTSMSVSNVATATEELSSSTSEIERQVGQSSSIAGRAVEEANRTDNQVRGLSEAALRIGEVVKMISDIAEQTNLLALNATIEAARAGESGRGFAVVAAEVKDLATQTGNATNEISQQISAIQEETREAVNAIQSITSTITEISDITTSVVDAVNQQNIATAEISSNVQQVTTATQEVMANMQDLSQVANNTDHAAAQVTSVSSGLSEQAKLVKSQVEQFLADVRAA